MTDATTLRSDLLILGAGLTGLMTAFCLRHTKLNITLLDKGRSVGGRLATRRVGKGLADHGAQFFTVRDPAFGTLVAAWQQAGLVYVWSTGWGDGSLDTTPSDGYPRYAVRGGMNALTKHLATELASPTVTASITIATDVQVTALAAGTQGWDAVTTSGAIYHAPTLVTTAPVPQTLALLAAGQTVLAPATQTALNRIHYAPCLCLLLDVEGEVCLPEPGARQTPNATVTWVADNQRKGISPGARILTVHANGEFSHTHYAADDATVIDLLLPEVQPLLSPAAHLREVQVKRWRYALPLVLHPARYLLDTTNQPVYFGGDAFGGPRVEGAALSGMAIAQALGAA